jgi:hypothetical protein
MKWLMTNANVSELDISRAVAAAAFVEVTTSLAYIRTRKCVQLAQIRKIQRATSVGIHCRRYTFEMTINGFSIIRKYLTHVALSSNVKM